MRCSGGCGEQKFQNGASCLYFSQLMLVSSGLDLHPPPYLNHTSNNDFEERVRGSTMEHPSIWCKLYSQMCTMFDI